MVDDEPDLQFSRLAVATINGAPVTLYECSCKGFGAPWVDIAQLGSALVGQGGEHQALRIAIEYPDGGAAPTLAMADNIVTIGTYWVADEVIRIMGPGHAKHMVAAVKPYLSDS